MAEKVAKSDEDILKQIREDFSYVKSYWNENHEEARKDMDCVACIPPKDFSDDRAGRPCLWPDEISQYVKQANNNFRQSKRSIKISARSDDAKDVDAEHRQAYIRGIEYASQAQSIYTTAFESAMECGFGFFRATLRVTGPKGEQEPRLRRIPNWATVYPDPDAQEADFSDSSIYFITDTMRQKTFARRYPDATKRSFTPEDAVLAPGWMSGDTITVAEYWTREEQSREDGEKTYKVTQRITNGLEILETNEWIGSWIPIFGIFGEEIYIRNGNQSKRMFLSLVRRARTPQQMLAYIASQEAEEFGMAPRSPYLVLEGTVDGEIWKFAHKTPSAYLPYKIPTDWQPSWGTPPEPKRVPFIPNAEAYQVARESWRRAVQAAMGISPLPTAAQRQNEKSGIALEKIQNQESIGTFHFMDNFVRTMDNCGRQLNELITKLAELDSLPDQLLGKDQKDEDRILHVVSRNAESEHIDEADHFFAHRGQFQVTISDGPSYQSQREEQSALTDVLLQSLPHLGLPPQITQQVLAIAIKLKNIGTYGDEIADLLTPPDPNNMSPQAKAILVQSQGQIQALQQELQKLQLEKLGKVAETQGKLAIAQQEGQIRMAEADKEQETKVLVAEIGAKVQDQAARMELLIDMVKQWHDQAHDVALQQQQHSNAQQIAAQQQRAASESQASDQAHQAGMAAAVQPEAGA